MRRRDFLGRSVAAVAGVAGPSVIPAGVLGARARRGPNDRIRLGVVGLGGRAKHLVTKEGFADQARIVAVADCYLARCYAAAKWLPGAETWARYQDYRTMIEKENLDAVLVATTTHARALICMHVLEAGLDVYAEKPLTLTVAEGRALVQAVRKHKRVLQAGTQQRSMPINVHASRLVREGAIGKIHTVLACNFWGPQRWMPQPAQPMPDGLDWDQWCNQTELRPYHHDLQFGWAKWRDYDGGGQSWGVTGWGTHALDQVQCALGTDDTGPVEIRPEETGDHAKVTMRYADGTVLKLHGPKRDLADLGAIFIGEKGRIEFRRGSYLADPPELLAGSPDAIPPGAGEAVEHVRNFFDCVRTRNVPNAGVEAAHRATTVCHLVNICRALGRRLDWDPKAERFIDDDEANAMLARPRRKGYELPATA